MELENSVQNVYFQLNTSRRTMPILNFTLAFQITTHLGHFIISFPRLANDCHIKVQITANLKGLKKMVKRSLSAEQELFLCLSRLRCRFLGQNLANRYNISASQVSNIWLTWRDLLRKRSRQCLFGHQEGLCMIQYNARRI